MGKKTGILLWLVQSEGEHFPKKGKRGATVTGESHHGFPCFPARIWRPAADLPKCLKELLGDIGQTLSRELCVALADTKLWMGKPKSIQTAGFPSRTLLTTLTEL